MNVSSQTQFLENLRYSLLHSMHTGEIATSPVGQDEAEKTSIFLGHSFQAVKG